MRKYGWMITEDHVDGRIGVRGPRNCPYTPEEIEAKGKEFRLYDGDGELYYEGKIVMDDNCSGFEPLDDYGMPNAGATDIRYLQGAVWRTL